MQSGIPEILYEDNHLIIVYKPHGWLVHGDHTKDESLGDWLKLFIKKKYQKPGEVFLGTIHRLDRPVGGIMVFARTSKALERMNKLFSEKKVKKVYQAIIAKKPEKEKGVLLNWIWKNSKKNKVELSEFQANHEWKQAETHYQIIGNYGKFQLIQLIPITGRSHQLRAQLAYIGLPIIGDLKYGSKINIPDGNLALQCVSLSFQHPVTKVELEIKLKKIKWNI